MEPLDFKPEQFATEQAGTDWRGMDQWSSPVLSERLTQSHLNALDCIPLASKQLAVAAEAAAGRLAAGQGRLVYCGAGSAGLRGWHGAARNLWLATTTTGISAGGWIAFLGGDCW